MTSSSERFQDDMVTIYEGDALSVLRAWDAPRVHMVVTSPPYWCLRDYGTYDAAQVEAMMRQARPDWFESRSVQGRAPKP